MKRRLTLLAIAASMLLSSAPVMAGSYVNLYVGNNGVSVTASTNPTPTPPPPPQQQPQRQVAPPPPPPPTKHHKKHNKKHHKNHRPQFNTPPGPGSHK